MALAEWHRVWESCLRPNLATAVQTELNFVCDVADIETATLAVQHFLGTQKPLLTRLSVRLSRLNNAAIKVLAQSSVKHLSCNGATCAIPPVSTEYSRHSRLIDLPAELRQNILSFTDLVTYRGDVEWSPTHGMYFRSPSWYYGNGGRRGGPHGAQDQCHMEREPHPDRNTQFSCWEYGSYRGCFCISRHAAYSNYRYCSCWTPPTSLFPVCRLLRQDALRVFFSRNRFVVVPGGTGRRVEIETISPPRLPISIFLKDVVPTDALRHLRFLEVVSGPFGEHSLCSYCPPHSVEHLDWIRTLRFVKDRLSLHNLTIHIHVASWPEYNYEPMPLYLSNLTPTQLGAIKQSYLDTFGPLRLLRGLYRVCVHLPTRPPDKYSHFKRFKREWAMNKEWEKKIEKIIMRDPKYDSSIAGKRRIPPGRWYLEHNNLYPEFDEDINDPVWCYSDLYNS